MRYLGSRRGLAPEGKNLSRHANKALPGRGLREGIQTRTANYIAVSAAVSLQQARDKYPNALRDARTQAQITRAQLVGRCAELAAQGDGAYVKVGIGAIKFLEAGVRRPRLKTAVTLAAALATTIQDLFPSGVDDPDRVSGR